MLDVKTTNSLIILAKNGDESAKTALITENSPLIKSVIKKYLNNPPKPNYWKGFKMKLKRWWQNKKSGA